jgi:hypothetical protein
MSRFNMEFPDRELQDLREIQELVDAASLTSLIRTLCKIGVALIREQKKGAKVIVKRSNGTEVELMFL